jgi:hypothetical protein
LPSPIETSRNLDDEEVKYSGIVDKPRQPTPMRAKDPATANSAGGTFKFVGFDEFEEKKKKSITDILLGSSGKNGGTKTTPRIISIYYPNADPKASL